MFPPPNKDPRQLAFWQDEEGALWDALDELLIMTLTDAVAEGVSSLPANYRVLANFDLVNQKILNYAKDYRYSWIKSITDTTRTQVQQAVTDWMREGSPLSALESRLTPIFGQARADMIATTEVTRVYAEGNQEAWESTGVVSAVTWHTAEDELVCDICDPLDGTEIGIGDIDALPPAHVNCLTGDSFVLPIGGVTAGSERIFDGDIISIDTGENLLTVTPNHPILTRRGWVPACEIMQEDYLFCYGGSDGITSRIDAISNDDDNKIATIKNVFDSLGFPMFRVPMTAPDFHGDGANSQVATIRPNRKVVDNFKIITPKPVPQNDLSFRNVEFEIALSGLGADNSFLLRNNPAPTGVMGGPNLGHSCFSVHELPFESFGLGLAAWLDTELDKMFSENKTADTDLFSQLIFGLAGQITMRKVIKVTKNNFSGHVYNLQTESGLFVANGIITHNCRCFIEPIVDEELVKKQFEDIFQ